MKQELEGSVDDYAISIMEFPELSELYPFLAQERKEHPCVTFDSPADRRNLDTTVLYLHSSGSTGFPKPIPYTVRMIVGQRYGCEFPRYVQRDFAYMLISSQCRVGE